MKYSTVQYITVQYSTVQYSTEHYRQLLRVGLLRGLLRPGAGEALNDKLIHINNIHTRGIQQNNHMF